MTQVWVDKKRIRVKTSWRPGIADVCKSIGGYRWDPDNKTWHYPATPEVAGQIMDRFGELQATREFLAIAGLAQEADEARAKRDLTDLPEVPGAKIKPWLHQQQAYWFAHGQVAAMLAVGMGGGKTKIAIDLAEGWGVKKMLVIAPNNVVKVWPKEFHGSPEDGKVGHAQRPGWQIVTGLRRNRNGKLVAGSLKERKQVFADALAKASDEYPVCIVVNYEAAPQGVLGPWLLAQDWDLVVLDESHRIKSPGGTQSKFCESLRDHAQRRLALTGTPMPHSPLDVYAQYRFLDPGVFGTSYARFRQKYAVMGGWQGKQVLGMNEITAPDLAEKISRLAYIITNEELDQVLGLEEPLWMPTRMVTLDAKAQKAYDDLANDLVAGIEEGTVAVNNALTQLLRLQQVTSGHLPVESACDYCGGDGCDVCDGIGYRVDVVPVGTEKRDALADWCSDIQAPKWAGEAFVSPLLEPGEPIVVVTRFIHDLDSVKWVAEKQGRRYGELSGRRSDGLSEAATMSHDIDILGVQIQSGGVGIDLTRAHYAANYSVGFSLGDFEQWLKRTHRPGQKHRVVYQNFACEGTVDVAVFRALAERKEVVSAVMSDAKESGKL